MNKELYTLTASDLASAPYFFDRTAHKGLYGRTLVVAGSKDIYGACFFCAISAYKSGAGLVKIVTHENNRISLQHDLPEAMFSFYEESDAGFADDLLTDIGTFDTVVIGPGLSKAAVSVKLVETVIRNADYDRQILVFDADALNIIADNNLLFDELCDKVKSARSHVVFTPHEGELRRLCKSLQSSFDAKENGRALKGNELDRFTETFYEHTEIVLVRKGADTIIYGKKRYLNTTGNDGMATAGSGDVLAGIMGGALHRYILGGETDFAKAVAYCVYIHGYAGNLARDAIGPIGMMARDILDHIMV
ncbi:MAG: NAD(P)H-hydrate dehydratase [Lachnospiraceae bacterium]|nr:NAD(P)H-hydrate dehydratase [Lachnospiraceae bacterium]